MNLRLNLLWHLKFVLLISTLIGQFSMQANTFAYFEVNQGQHDLESSYFLNLESYSIGVSSDCITFTPIDPSIKASDIVIKLANRNESLSIKASDKLKTKVNYFRGSDENNWLEDITTFKSLTIHNSLNGKEVELTIKDGQLEVQVEGNLTDFINEIEVESNGIVLSKVSADHEIRRLPIQFKMASPNSPDYGSPIAPKKNQVVTSPEIIYSSYFGATGSESVSDMAVDADGNIYLIGKALPSTQWYIAKIRPGEEDFEFVNWYGSPGGATGESNPRRIEVDSKGNVIAAVTTNDTSLPTLNAIRSNFGINPYIVDIYIIKITAANEPVFATYFGGAKVDPNNNPLRLNGRDYLGGMTIDKGDNIWLNGETDGINFPTTSDAFRPSNIGRWDLFLTQLSPNGELMYSTLLGGEESDRINTGSDVKNGIDIDSMGRIYFLGYTENDISSFPANDLALNRENNFRDFVLAIFDPLLKDFIYSTFLGEFEPKFLQIDSKNRVHLAGDGTRSQLVNPIAGTGDQFAMVFRPLSRQIVFSSYIPCDRCELDDMIIGRKDHMFFIGTTRNDQVTTTDFLPQFGSGGNDLYLGELDIDRGRYDLGIVYGGNDRDEAAAIAFSKDGGTLYAAATTRSEDYFTTVDAVSPTQPGNGDVALTLFQIDDNASISYYDGNPKFFTEGATVKDLSEISDVEELVNIATTEREGVIADGVSKLLISLPFDEELEDVLWDIKEEYGMIEPLWTAASHTFDDGEYLFALYTPPSSFPEPQPDNNLQLEANEGAGSTKVFFKIDYVIEGLEGRQIDSFPIQLYRPPVVLVHGTFDDPENCWKTGLTPNDLSIYDQLQEQDFKVFTCDFSNTNGDQKIGSCSSQEFPNVNTRISSFECNKRVVYENPGGIRDAISFFRDSINIAATQADAIGHSMGGVLIRVYASDRRQEGIISYETDYYREDNFMKGDVNRIITMASTHHGSDVAWLLNELSSGIALLPAGASFFELILPAVLPMAWIGAIYEKTGAVEDQVPQSPALQRIGPTPIPSHAMAFYVNETEKIRNNRADTAQFYFKRMYQVGMLLYFYESITDQLLTNSLGMGSASDASKRTQRSIFKIIRPGIFGHGCH